MTEAAESWEPQYPQSVLSLDVATDAERKELGAALLTEWVEGAYEYLGERGLGLPFFGFPRARRVYRESEDWKTLSVKNVLFGWIFLATRDPSIAALYGTSTQPFDLPYFQLEEDALEFLNDMLRRSEKFDEALVQQEVRLFWEELGSDTQIYEIGGFPPHFRAEATNESIPTGPGLEVRRIQGQWAAERFDNAAAIPTSCWSVAAILTVKPVPSAAWGSWQRDRGRKRQEELALLTAVLPFRMAGTPVVAFEGYRLGVSGYRAEPSQETVSDRWLSDDHVYIELSSAQMDQIGETGALLGDRIKSLDSLLEENPRDRLELALRSFQGSWERRNWQDRVVDITVALEALFGAGQQNELRHTVAMRAALLLATDPDESRRTFRAVKYLYDLRSTVVHGTPSDGVKDAKKVITAWRGSVPAGASPSMAGSIGARFVGRALNAFLRLEKAPGLKPFAKNSDFPEQLDGLAFDSGRRSELQRIAKIASVPADGKSRSLESNAESNLC